MGTKLVEMGVRLSSIATGLALSNHTPAEWIPTLQIAQLWGPRAKGRGAEGEPVNFYAVPFQGEY